MTKRLIIHLTTSYIVPFMKSDLTEYVDEALSRRIDEARYFQTSEDLIGDCFFNTKVLSTVLDENNVSYDIYAGALIEDYREDNIPETFEEAKKCGLVHYWIEVNGYVCEISSECKKTEYLEQPVVLPFRPDNYIVFEDSIKNSL